MMSRGELGFGFFLFIVTLRNFTVISRLPSLFCDECPDRYSEQSGDSQWPWIYFWKLKLVRWICARIIGGYREVIPC